MHSIVRSCDAMATRFEMQLIGDDDEHLDAVAHAIAAEIERLDRLLSRFDPRSEVSRINRLAAREPVIVDAELCALLVTCVEAAKTTGNFFSIVAQDHHLADPMAIELDTVHRTVAFASAAVRLDFGAIGKGYALDRAAEILHTYGVESALLHGGTSSILALGTDLEGQPWRVGIAEPWIDARPTRPELARVTLLDQAMSTSAALAPDRTESDIFDPTTGRRLTAQCSCSVVAPTVTEAEILSTALLAMGRQQAAAYTELHRKGPCAVAWISVENGAAKLAWL
ncbi:MAG TPA: FAD:protein FMN transferase [Pirellulales bacterium]|nr:FAD:protein FMN transferase [Pirellulales bacterium]